MAKDWRVDVFEGADATKRVLRDPEFAGHDVIHFATHAVMSHEFPELSGLVLSQVDADGRSLDGLLHLQEIYDLPIDAELVVLSACRTGRGRNLRGEGPVSLGRAFLFAGARRVLTTHWGIPDDVTAELMAAFYAGILERGLTPPAALREAQLHILNDPSFGHPFFWAAFALAGTIVD
jgi:CHAT domain-containing protein